MTVLMREELNDADLAWAAADASLPGAIGQFLLAQQGLATGNLDTDRAPRDGEVVDPAVLRAWGAL